VKEEKEEGERRKKEEGRRKKEEGRRAPHGVASACATAKRYAEFAIRHLSICQFVI
jgi:hypothetical protein